MGVNKTTRMPTKACGGHRGIFSLLLTLSCLGISCADRSTAIEPKTTAQVAVPSAEAAIEPTPDVCDSSATCVAASSPDNARSSVDVSNTGPTEDGRRPGLRPRLSTNGSSDAGPAQPPDPHALCQVDGQYFVTGTVRSGTCPITQAGATDAFRTNRDGTVSMTAEGLEGECIGTMSGCTWTASCLISMRSALKSGDEGAFVYSYTFNSQGFSGAVVKTLPPLASIPGGCAAIVDASGVRR
jgi:hypothetical protein